MARQVEGPWFRASKGTWYATLNGKSVSLGVKGEDNRQQAQTAWHRLMARDNTATLPNDTPQPKPKAEPKQEPAPEPKAEATVKELVDAFLAAKKGTIEPQTFTVYGCLLKHVTDAYGTLKAKSLKAPSVSRWLATLPVSANTQYDIGGTMASAFKWAEEEGMIEGHPLKGLKRPGRTSRGTKAVVSPEAHRKLLEAAKPALRLLLILLHETGARPSELARLTAQDIDFPNSVVVLNKHKTDAKTGKPRIIVLSPLAVELLKTQAEAHPVGPILRNSKGRPWTKDAVGNAMRKASKAAGVKGIAYGFRHTFATDALVRGLPDAQVAALLGHSSTAMLHKHYSHLTSQAQAMRDALNKVRG